MATRRPSIKRTEPQTVLEAGSRLGVLETYIGIPLRLAYRAVLTQVNEQLADADLTPVEFALLAVIEANREASFGEIGDILGITKSNLAPIAAKLQKRGLVSRSASTIDARRQHLSLTATGQAKLARGKRVHDELEKHLISSLGQTQHDELVHLLRALSQVPLLTGKVSGLEARARKFGVR